MVSGRTRIETSRPPRGSDDEYHRADNEHEIRCQRRRQVEWTRQVEDRRNREAHRAISPVVTTRDDDEARPCTTLTNRSADSCMRRSTGAG